MLTGPFFWPPNKKAAILGKSSKNGGLNSV
jgi:hypothetical protein